MRKRTAIFTSPVSFLNSFYKKESTSYSKSTGLQAILHVFMPIALSFFFFVFKFVTFHAIQASNAKVFVDLKKSHAFHLLWFDLFYLKQLILKKISRNWMEIAFENDCFDLCLHQSPLSLSHTLNKNIIQLEIYASDCMWLDSHGKLYVCNFAGWELIERSHKTMEILWIECKNRKRRRRRRIRRQHKLMLKNERKKNPNELMMGFRFISNSDEFSLFFIVTETNRSIRLMIWLCLHCCAALYLWVNCFSRNSIWIWCPVNWSAMKSIIQTEFSLW